LSKLAEKPGLVYDIGSILQALGPVLHTPDSMPYALLGIGNRGKRTPGKTPIRHRWILRSAEVGHLFFPIDITLGEYGKIYILEKGANRLQVFEIKE
jgi:hypothetical protein